GDARYVEGLLDLAGEDDLGALRIRCDEPGLLQAGEVDRRRAHASEVAGAHFGCLLDGRREEAALGEPALEGHLPAFEADLVIAARARVLALVAAARRLAEARADAASDAPPCLLRACGRLDGVEFHVPYSSTFTR